MDMNMDFRCKLPIPMEIKEQFPATKFVLDTVDESVAQMKQIFTGESDRFILVIGPCSADNEDSVMDYISRLASVQEKVKDKM